MKRTNMNTRKFFLTKGIYFFTSVILILFFLFSDMFSCITTAYAQNISNGTFKIDLTTYNNDTDNNRTTTLSFTINNTGDDFDGVCRILLESNGYYSSLLTYDTELNLACNTTKQFDVTIDTYSIENSTKVHLQMIDSKNNIVYTREIQNIVWNTASLNVGVLCNDITNYLDFEMNGNTIDTDYGSGNGSYYVNVMEISPDNITEEELNSLFVLVIDDYDTSKLSAEALDTIATWNSKNNGIIILGGGSYAQDVLSSELVTALNLNYNYNVPQLYNNSALIGGSNYTDVPCIEPQMLFNNSIYPLTDNIYALDTYTVDQPLYMASFSFKDYFLSKDSNEYSRQIYLKELFIDLYNRHFNISYSYSIDYYDFDNLFDSLAGIDNIFPVGLITLVLAIYIILLCPIVHFILKRLNKQEFFWIYAPALSIMFIMLLILLSIPGRKIIPQIYSINLIDTSKRTAPLTYFSGFKSRLGKWSFKLNENYENSFLLDLNENYNDFSSATSQTDYDLNYNLSSKTITVNPNRNYQMAFFKSACPLKPQGTFEISSKDVIENKTGEVFDYILFKDAYSNVYIYDGKKYPDTLDLQKADILVESINSNYSYGYMQANSIYYEYEDSPQKYSQIPKEYIVSLDEVQSLINNDVNYAVTDMYIIGIKKSCSPVSTGEYPEENISCFYTILK